MSQPPDVQGAVLDSTFVTKRVGATGRGKTVEVSVGRSWVLVVSADMPGFPDRNRAGKQSRAVRMGVDATSVPASLLVRTTDCALAVEVSIPLSPRLSTKEGVVVVVSTTHQ